MSQMQSSMHACSDPHLSLRVHICRLALCAVPALQGTCCSQAGVRSRLYLECCVLVSPSLPVMVDALLAHMKSIGEFLQHTSGLM